jgi:hypothetical protein
VCSIHRIAKAIWQDWRAGVAGKRPVVPGGSARVDTRGAIRKLGASSISSRSASVVERGHVRRRSWSSGCSVCSKIQPRLMWWERLLDSGSGSDSGARRGCVHEAEKLGSRASRKAELHCASQACLPSKATNLVRNIWCSARPNLVLATLEVTIHPTVLPFFSPRPSSCSSSHDVYCQVGIRSRDQVSGFTPTPQNIELT